MELTGHEDLRIQRTINSIHDAFKTLICEKDYAKITVKELAERAQINKKTFYRYYPTLDALLAEIQSEYSRGYLALTKDYQYPLDLAKSIQTFFEYSVNQDQAYEKITISTNIPYVGIRQEMIDEVMGKTWGQSQQFQNLSEWQQKMVTSFIQQTGLNVYREWINNGKQISMSDAIDTSVKLIEGGIANFL